MSKKKIVVSACLLGNLCRYDGKTKKNESVVDALKGYEIIPFCPEAPLFGTPREKISVIELDNALHIIKDETHEDVTNLLEYEIRSFRNKYIDIDLAILKSKSPSCGFKTTPILDKNRKLLRYGDGIAIKFFKDMKIIDENLCLKGISCHFQD